LSYSRPLYWHLYNSEVWMHIALIVRLLTAFLLCAAAPALAQDDVPSQDDIKPLLPAAKGHRYYILHSPQDEVCKYVFVNMAKTQLTGAGAAVMTADYEGGHGWHGDVFGNIAAGVEWLQEGQP
jgi:predicted esterase